MKKNESFGFEIVAKGDFVDEGFHISTIVIRLNPVAMNEWIMSSLLNSRYAYKTQEEWEAYETKTEAMRNAWEQKILDGLKFTADTGYSITQSVSEIFTVVLFKKI